MKKISLILLSVLLLASCSKTPQQKAEKAVLNYLKTSKVEVKDCSFGKLDTIELSSVKEYKQALDSFNYYREEKLKGGDQFKMSAMQQGLIRMKQQMKELKALYKVRRYKLPFSFNKENVTVHDTVFLNDRLSKVVE